MLHVLMETIPDRIYFKDLNSCFVHVSAAQANLLGAPSIGHCIGKSDFDFFSRDHAERAFADEQAIIRTGQPMVGQEERITTLIGTQAWVSATKLPWRDAAGKIIGTFGLSRDITAAKQAAEKLTEERNLLRTIIDQLPSRIFVKDAAACFLINNLAHLHLLGVSCQEDARGRTTLDFFPNERGTQAIADDQFVLQTGTPIISQEKSDFGPEGQTNWSLTTKMPLRDLQNEIIGLVGISHDITALKRTEQELQRRTTEMETDLRMARQIQEAFFPKVYPVFPRGVPAEASELRFAHCYVPAATLGGDFFDIITISDTQCGVLICDVMGHGVRAGLITALIRGAVEEFGPRTDNPAQVISEINHGLIPIVHQTGQPIFATAFYAVIDTIAGTLAYANAGHPPPLILREAVGTVTSLAFPDPEPAAGLIEDFNYSTHTIAFQPGDTLLGYTDGLFEASNGADTMFGEKRLRTLITQNIGLPGVQLIERLVKEVAAFTGHSDFDDDICALTVESTGKTCALRPALTYDI
jgi:sigma-B regulation protein RsbU (phosphoserine phosphatase)